VEHLREYQDYVLAYRLRALVGGSSKPASGYLSLAEYANKRLQRQGLAEMLLKKSNYHADMRRVDKLTEEMNFGFWHNPGESVDFLRKMTQQGGCKALESEDNFVTYLLTPLERSKLSFNEERTIARYYLGLLRASSAYLDAEVFTRLRGEVEPLRETMPIFVIHTDEDVARVS
jgi:hypothetical protein